MMNNDMEKSTEETNMVPDKHCERRTGIASKTIKTVKYGHYKFNYKRK